MCILPGIQSHGNEVCSAKESLKLLRSIQFSLFYAGLLQRSRQQLGHKTSPKSQVPTMTLLCHPCLRNTISCTSHCPTNLLASSACGLTLLRIVLVMIVRDHLLFLRLWYLYILVGDCQQCLTFLSVGINYANAGRSFCLEVGMAPSLTLLAYRGFL